MSAKRPFAVVDESAEWVVVDKPAFLLVHPKKPGGPRTLWDGLRELLAFELANGGQVSLVNRLDRETSGLILAAKTAQAARRFHTAMMRRAIAKEYLAIVWGWPERDEFTVSAPILRQGERGPTAIYLKRCVHPEGAESVTRFRVERRFEKPTSAGTRFALVRAFPETGRTHQIRIHLAHAGYPIIGDKIYGPDERCYLQFIETGWTPALERRLLLPRHALHSARLRLETPEDGALDWHSPLPPDLAAWMGN
ncbi:MAG: RNA pseudouridine synthase [Chthoniobacteraceae bacterium]|nr:RNA pseudouridine synthase [Chthoniobacteraceae bacterium]